MHDVLVKELAELLLKRGLKLATAESCTGGGLASALTDWAGGSEWFDRGFVTYSNLAKVQMLGVTNRSLDDQGAVSEQVVLEMARGAVLHSEANLSVSISGVAGPGGGSPEKPVGTVWIAWKMPEGDSFAKLFQFDGDRREVRYQAVTESLRGLISALKK